jgi:hypothetical protein
MTMSAEKLAAEIHALSDVGKLRLVDEILSELDKPDPDIGENDRIVGTEIIYACQPIRLERLLLIKDEVQKKKSLQG